MNRALFGLAITFIFVLSMFTVAQAEERLATFTTSRPFTTAEAAVSFTNKLPLLDFLSATFVCEFKDGSPTSAQYRVLYTTNEVSVLVKPEMPWQVREGFSNPENAVDFINARKATAKFVPCWNPNKNPISTSITVFYRLSLTQTVSTYQVSGTFSDAKSATEYVNDHPEASSDPQFVPQLFAARQVEPSWSIISLVDREIKHDNKVWRVIENDTRGFPLQLETAITAIHDTVRDVRFVATFSTATIHSRIVLFVLEDRTNERYILGQKMVKFRIDVRAALLGIPVIINLDEELLRDVTSVTITNMAETAFEEFFRQTKIALWNEEVRTYFAPGQNPREIARTMLRAPNTLNVFFSAVPPFPLDRAESRPGLNGERFCIIWWKLSASRKELVSSLIHSLGHKFSAQDVNDPTSAMYFGSLGTGSSWDIDEHNLQLIRQLVVLAKRWKSLDIVFSLTD